MNAYRLTHTRYAEDLSGFGAYKTGGRWNPKGYYTLYLSEHPCGAILELLIHLPPQIVPDDYSITTFDILNMAKIETVKEAELPTGWRQGKYNISTFQKFGKERLFEKSLLGLRINSTVAYPSYNLVLNPKHNEFNHLIKIVNVEKYYFDSRLFQ